MANSVENTPVPLAILISGRGSNMRAIVEAIGEGRVQAVVRVVVANREDAAGLVWARAAGIETLVVPHRAYATRDLYDRALVDALKSRGVRLVCLAGFMRRLGRAFCDAFPLAVLNVHPSLLPSFPGVNAQAQALAHGVKVSGATVHFVTPDLDAGPIIMQAAVPVRDDDTSDTLSARILVQEHLIYPDAVQRVIAGGWRIDGRRVVQTDV
jgi:phosphoribosylglycinamide formyltransferase-1